MDLTYFYTIGDKSIFFWFLIFSTISIFFTMFIVSKSKKLYKTEKIEFIIMYLVTFIILITHIGMAMPLIKYELGITNETYVFPGMENIYKIYPDYFTKGLVQIIDAQTNRHFQITAAEFTVGRYNPLTREIQLLEWTEDVYVHEIGHHIWYQLAKETHKKWQELYETNIEFISYYSMTDVTEFHAEVFACYYSPMHISDTVRRINDTIIYTQFDMSRTSQPCINHLPIPIKIQLDIDIGYIKNKYKVK